MKGKCNIVIMDEHCDNDNQRKFITDKELFSIEMREFSPLDGKGMNCSLKEMVKNDNQIAITTIAKLLSMHFVSHLFENKYITLEMWAKISELDEYFNKIAGLFVYSYITNEYTPKVYSIDYQNFVTFIEVETDKLKIKINTSRCTE